MSVRSVPCLRHPTLGTPMPWLDSSPVPAATMCQYLRCSEERLRSLSAHGCFAHPGCTIAIGPERPVTYYIPARCWQANHWLPDGEVLQHLALRPSQTSLQQLAEQLGKLQSTIVGLIENANTDWQSGQRRAVAR